MFPLAVRGSLPFPNKSVVVLMHQITYSLREYASFLLRVNRLTGRPVAKVLSETSEFPPRFSGATNPPGTQD